MINFLVFAVKRYARFCSYLAAFLAGLAFTLQGALFWCPLAVSIVLGSLAAYEGSFARSAGRAGFRSCSSGPASSASSSSSVPEQEKEKTLEVVKLSRAALRSPVPRPSSPVPRPS